MGPATLRPIPYLFHTKQIAASYQFNKPIVFILDPQTIDFVAATPPTVTAIGLTGRSANADYGPDIKSSSKQWNGPIWEAIPNATSPIYYKLPSRRTSRVTLIRGTPQSV